MTERLRDLKETKRTALSAVNAEKRFQDPMPATPSHMQMFAQGSGTSLYLVDRENGSPWVMKQANQDGYPQHRLAKEFQILETLSHPNIVDFRAAGDWGMAMRDFGGIALQDYIDMDSNNEEKEEDASLFTWHNKMDIMRQTAQALSYLHTRNILHGDLKADNILIGNENPENVKICDFGCSIVLDKSGCAPAGTEYQGNYLWAAPETIFDEEEEVVFGTPADIWAFGITIYQLITGEIPYLDPETMEDNVELLGTQPEHPIVEELLEIMQERTDEQALAYCSLYHTFLECTKDDPHQRPTAKDVVKMLQF